MQVVLYNGCKTVAVAVVVVVAAAEEEVEGRR